ADHRVLVLQGPDAVRFAHAQFMSDVVGLADGNWQWSGWLTPKGRVVALFAVLKLDPQHLWLLLPDADPDALAAELRRFIFRSKLTVQARPELGVSGTFANDSQARGAVVAMRGETSVAMDFSADGGTRTLTIAPGLRAADDPAAMSSWRAFDLTHGLPRLDSSQVDRWTPQQLSLDRLQAYSVKKGCYPGQEIVARTHFLGQAKRGLVLLGGDAPFAVGAEVFAGERVAGTIVSSAGLIALAVLPLAREPDQALTVNGAEVRERPLQDALAR
ncbi:MAG: folate-binding protein, partial [Luteimonas sp.]